MNAQLLFQCLVRCLFLGIWLSLPATILGQAINPGLVAEIWPLEQKVEEGSRGSLEILRGQPAPENMKTVKVDNLEIPARDEQSLVRVRGVIVAPESSLYAFVINGYDNAELWIEDPELGEWKLAQRERNPIKRGGSIKMEAAVPRRFEFWTKGQRAMSVGWNSVKLEANESKRVIVDEAILAPPHVRGVQSVAGERHGNGLRDEWKKRWGLDVSSEDGPNGPWGDPDGDGVLNWQEQRAGTDPLTADANGKAGLVRWEIWRKVDGHYPFDLTRSVRFPKEPTEVRFLHRLEIPGGTGNDYGSRVRGLIKAPQTGDYTFMITADDTAELWLGETSSALSRKQIARVERAGGQSSVPGKFVRRSERSEKPLLPEQVSARIALQKGETYYVEILHKQHNQVDHCSVGWIRPGSAEPEIIGADVLVSLPAEAEGSGEEQLPDAWLRSTGLLANGISPEMSAASADPDNDGLTNWEEFKAGTNPLKADAKDTARVSRRITSELWDKLPGNRLQDLVFAPQFPSKPTSSTLVDNMDFSNEGENYGVRIRGYLTAPEDGSYVFSLAGNDACSLFLAESEEKFSKHLIAQITRETAWRSFGKDLSQSSERITLKAGKKYYIEILYKRGIQPAGTVTPFDHASVAWEYSGRPRTVISADYLSPYQSDPRDFDDDDLPDEWEKRHGLDPNDASGVNGAWGDPDGDWLENFREFQAGLNPKIADVENTPGFALWECWADTVTTKVVDLKASPAFPLKPTQRKWVTSLEGPQRLANFYGSRLRAYLIPPITGDYTFAIAGDNSCQLWLSTTDKKYSKQHIASVQKWTGRRSWYEEPGQISRSIRLEAGKRYFVEVLHVQGTKEDHASVAWTLPGKGYFEVIRDKAIAGFVRDPNDLDDDDLPDDWEKANNFPTDVANGDQDTDKDGLTNREELNLGTNPHLADTDGDGVSDFDEVRLYHSNPLRIDASPAVKLSDLPLAGYRALPGDWSQMPDGVLRSVGRRGAVDLVFDLEKAGVYLLEIQAVARSSDAYTPSIPLIARVDGVEIGRAEVGAGGSRNRWLTTWLSSGKHTVTIDNRNVRSGLILEVSAVSLYQHVGKDENRNGTPDWLDQLFQRDSRFDMLSFDSAISPACMEGVARTPDDVRISTAAGDLKIQAGLAGRWFANLPLEPSGDTKIIAIFENGSLREEQTLRWVATDLFSAPKSLRVRVGDSLKITAVPPGTETSKNPADLTRDGVALGSASADAPVVVKFERAGTVTLAASFKTNRETLSVAVKVEVIGADFGRPFSVASGNPRLWDLLNVSHALLVEADRGLSMEEMDRQPPKSRRFRVNYPTGQSGAPRVVARLWKEGPIAAAATVNAFRFVPSTITGDHQIVDVLADGTRVVEVRYVIDGPVPADLSVWLQLYVTDAVFENGNAWYELTAADFDAKGEATILIYKAPGNGNPIVCHWIRPYFKDHLSD
jgi:PA14 domain/Bacterial TSP3 repeat